MLNDLILIAASRRLGQLASLAIIFEFCFQSPPGQVEQAVKDAIDCGYRHIGKRAVMIIQCAQCAYKHYLWFKIALSSTATKTKWEMQSALKSLREL